MKNTKSHQFFDELRQLVIDYGEGYQDPSVLLGPLCQVIAYVTHNGNIKEESILRAVENQLAKDMRRRQNWVHTAGINKRGKLNKRARSA